MNDNPQTIKNEDNSASLKNDNFTRDGLPSAH